MLHPVPLRCLVIDDSEEFLAAATRLLEAQGVEVVGSATSGAQALRLAAAEAPDVALVDIELGDENGAELATEMTEDAPSTRVILISAHEQADLQELLTGSRAVGFLPKTELGADAIAELLR
jgi:DNA-binding NarL/FixJ family response regulator